MVRVRVFPSIVDLIDALVSLKKQHIERTETALVLHRENYHMLHSSLDSCYIEKYMCTLMYASQHILPISLGNIYMCVHHAESVFNLKQKQQQL